MRSRYRICYRLFLLILLVSFMVTLDTGHASEREVHFEILERGDFSGYGEEAYIVVTNEYEWITLWEKHILLREPKEPLPSIDFSRSLVVCAFMGKCPTTGYSIDIKRIWTDGEQVFVEVVKCGPHEGFAVGEMITCPYVMALTEKTDMPFVFLVLDVGNGTAAMLAEFSSSAVMTLIVVLGCFAIFIKIKIKK